MKSELYLWRASYKPYLIKLHLSPKPVLSHSSASLYPALPPIFQLPVPLLPLSFTPNLTTVILSTINSLSHNYTVSSRSATLLLVLSLKLLSPIISLPSYARSTGWGSLNASNTSFSHLPRQFSQQPNLRTCITSSPLDVLLVLALHLHPSLIAREPISSSLKITDRSFRHSSPCLLNQLPLSLRQPHSGTSSYTSDSPIPSPITSSSSDSPLCSSITRSIFHSRLKTYLFNKSYPP